VRRQPLRGQGASPSVRRRKPNGPLLLRAEYFHFLPQNPCRRAKKCRFFPGHGVNEGEGREGLTISPSGGMVQGSGGGPRHQFEENRPQLRRRVRFDAGPSSALFIGGLPPPLEGAQPWAVGGARERPLSARWEGRHLAWMRTVGRGCAPCNLENMPEKKPDRGLRDGRNASLALPAHRIRALRCPGVEPDHARPALAVRLLVARR
jgi:hypothetical protein